jgi:hypothetical protein
MTAGMFHVTILTHPGSECNPTSGEDLTPYRHLSKKMQRALRRFGPCEKLGLDECWVGAVQVS